jgi:CBS domain-containing protein
MAGKLRRDQAVVTKRPYANHQSHDFRATGRSQLDRTDHEWIASRIGAPGESALDLANIMKSPVHTVKSQDTVAHARAIIEKYRIRQLPVVVDRRLVGIVTDRDLRDAWAAEAIAADAPAADRITVDAVMTTKVLTLSPANSAEEAARIMLRERIGSIPIVEHRGLVGIVTRSNILEAFISANEAGRK